MKKTNNKIVGITVLLAIFFVSLWAAFDKQPIPAITDNQDVELSSVDTNALTIQHLRSQQYPGSDIVIEQTLPISGRNYTRYVASYMSEGNKIYALLTVPTGPKPENGWPIIIFNHGYIPPTEYRTTERYIAYTDAFSRAGYIVFKPDYRGHGDSEGEALGGYGSNAYTIDVLNALSSIKKYEHSDPKKIGMWGHSMGGFITLRNMVVATDIKAGVIWAGVVGSYDDLLNNWRRTMGTPSVQPSGTARRWRQQLIEEYGTPEQNSDFWNSISATHFLSDISGPIQLHHGTNDTSVPVLFSQQLRDRLEAANKPVEYFEYAGDDHNISNNLTTALGRSVEFFDKHVKGVTP